MLREDMTKLPLTWAWYRVVRDNYSGYEAQVKRWWWPFWRQIGFCNTHRTLESAETHCRQHAVLGNAVLWLGRLPSSTAGHLAIRELERLQRERASA